MRLFLSAVAAITLISCEAPTTSPSAAPPPAEPAPTLGPDGVKLGSDIRQLSAAFFDNTTNAAQFAAILEYCSSATTSEECNQTVSAANIADFRVRTPLRGRININGTDADIDVHFTSRFKINTIDVDFGDVNQASYEALLASLGQRYDVVEAAASEYEAYNSTNSGCLASANPERTVVLVARKRPERASNDPYGRYSYLTGRAIESVRVIYRTPDASNGVSDFLRDSCLAMDASGL